MNGWIIFLIGLVVLLGTIWFTMIRLDVEYSRKQEKDQLNVEFSAWWRLIRYKINVPLFNLEPEGIEYTKNAQEANKKKKKKLFTFHDLNRMRLKIDSWMKLVHDLKGIIRETLKKIRCDRLEWNTKIGLGDAAATGTFTGLVWGIKSCIVAVIAHYLSLRSMPRIQVAPQFQSTWLESNFKMSLRFRLGMIVLAGLKVYFSILRRGEKLPK